MTASRTLLPRDLRVGLFLLLAIVMLATRSHHFAALPDASWAVFFAGGFYLSWRIAFPLLFALAVAIDFAVIANTGTSFWDHYCMSAAYWFLLPSYAALWAGGAWLRRHHAGLRLRDLGLLGASALVAVTTCYLVSNGSFYWLGDAVPEPRTFGGWLKNLGDWYLPFLKTTLVYIAIGAALHVLTVLAVRALPQNGDATQHH